MNVNEASDYLTARGYRCRGGTVRKLWKAGKLRCWRGPTDRGPMQFRPADLDAFLECGAVTGKGDPSPKSVRIAQPAKARKSGTDWGATYKDGMGA